MKNLIPKFLYDILVCPDCKTKLEYTKDHKALFCKNCKSTFKIKNGIPDFINKIKRE